MALSWQLSDFNRTFCVTPQRTVSWGAQSIHHLTGAADESVDGDSGVQTKTLLKCTDLATVGVKVNRCLGLMAYRSRLQEAALWRLFQV